MTVTLPNDPSRINTAISEQSKKGLHCIERRAIGPKGQTVKLFFEAVPVFGANGYTHEMKK